MLGLEAIDSVPGATHEACHPTPAEVFRARAAQSRIAFLDGRAAAAHAPRSLIAWNARGELRIESDASVSVDGSRRRASDPLAAMDAFLASEARAGRTVIGALAYELRGLIEPKAAGRHRSSGPLAVLVAYDTVLEFDHHRDTWSAPPPQIAAAAFDRCSVSELRVSSDAADYARRFAAVRAWIGAGDVYQVNLALTFEAAMYGNPAGLYQRLAARQPVAYGAYVDCGDFQLLSNSPELFLERRGAEIVTRPIKGTRPRGEGPRDDERLRAELRADPKERAEHVMIVDLERNDLGRIAVAGSVRVAEWQTVRTLPTLHHLESTVAATLLPGLRFSDIVRATFPGGSITGAPKIRAMQIIDRLEDEPRGFYTGAILHHRPDGDFTMSMAIRTATVRRGRIRYAAGGGLVWDSVDTKEHAECLLKARAFLEAADRA
jgi:para-aminobenzoate synthetase / 4-amino-4-deoxychorismate lyase